MKKKLPIGYSNLEKIIQTDCLYVDKTIFIKDLVETGSYYFLSRPRRFGKSLLLDTIRQAFWGKKELFKNLYLENNWDWSIIYPVISIDFAGGELRSLADLTEKITTILNENANKYQIEFETSSISDRFRELIIKLHNKYKQQVVILVDEYDKPILDNITDKNVSLDMRSGLRDLYSVIKASDEYLKFVLLTGVSKFSKVSLFSGLNNLQDITLDTRYANICGYTQSELWSIFAPYLDGVDAETLKLWYNGYNFGGTLEQKVYNPFDILLFIDSGKQYKNYWIETGNTSFLMKLLKENQYFIPDLESVVVGEKVLANCDIDDLPITTLLFQAGYLTIKSIARIGTQLAYELTYPNLEVKASLNDSIAELGTTIDARSRSAFRLSKILNSNSMDGIDAIFSSHFASIPHDWYRNNKIAHYEGFYSSIVYSYFCALGYDLITEDATSYGKIDLTVKLPDKILIIEFKLDKYGDAKDAIMQIKNNGYLQKYLEDGKPIYLLGISFNVESKNVADFVWELYNNQSLP